MKIRSVVPRTVVSYFWRTEKAEKNKKKQKKTSVKHIRYSLIGGCVNKGTVWIYIAASRGLRCYCTPLVTFVLANIQF